MAKTLSDGPSSALPPTLSPVYSSAVVPPPPRKSETKRAISNIISSLSPKRFALLPFRAKTAQNFSSCTREYTVVLNLCFFSYKSKNLSYLPEHDLTVFLQLDTIIVIFMFTMSVTVYAMKNLGPWHQPLHDSLYDKR